jgi:hypothetical protein
MSHGIREEEASKLIVYGFVEWIVKESAMDWWPACVGPATRGCCP